MSPRPTAWGAYAQIAETMRQRIERGVYAPGERLPSESALCREFGVARNTVRRALAELETGRLIETHPGVGRVVREADAAEPRSGPAYRRIADDLRARIVSGELMPGDPIPSEATVSERYGVARGTARQALADLEGAGLVESRHGKGRFVRGRP